MSLTEAQVQFAAEFVTLVVAASALALVILRPVARRDHDPGASVQPAGTGLLAVVAAAASLVVLAAAAFAHGSLLVSGPNVRWLGLGRLAGAVALFGSFPNPAGRRVARSRSAGVLLGLGSIVWAAAGASEVAQAPEYATDVLLVAGSLVIAAALVSAAQRAVAVRVAASGAVILLLVVIVLALALSTVISSSVQSQELNRLAARAHIEQATISDPSGVSEAARLVQADLALFSEQANDPLYDFAFGSPSQMSAAAAIISQRLQALTMTGETGSLSYASPDGTSVLQPGMPQPVPGPGLGPNSQLQPVSCSAGKQGLFQLGSEVVLAASSPECLAGTGRLLGVAISSLTLDNRYLASRRNIDPSVALALVFDGRVVATAGMTTAEAGRAVKGFDSSRGNLEAQAVGDQFVSVGQLTVAGSSQTLSLVLTSPATSVLSTRSQLFRTLFLIAFGGTVLALGLAIFTGDRITAGLRRLTRAASAIQSGDIGVRAGVGGEDEVAALGSAFDAMLDSVTAQSAALQAAAEDEARLRNRLEAVVGGMTDALVAVDAYGRITDFNPAAENLTGVEAAKAVGAPAEQIIRIRADDGSLAGRQLFRGGARQTAIMGHVLAVGGEIPVAVSSGALHAPDGDLVGTVLVFRDMRREHEVEQMKTEFLSRVGHELRTPLTGILGYADILLRRDVPAERARAWHEEILVSARRLLRIVEMLEFFASEGAGRIVLRPEPVDIRALVNGIASSWAGRLPANLTLGRRVSREEALASADRRWLSLAVDELIDNAVKFSPEGGRILVKVSGSEDVVEIAVSDQGMGMTAEQHEVIFGEFVQGDNSDTRQFGGLGLGLAVVRRVVEGHAGTVTCRSAPGRGTTFVITLPAWPDGKAPGEGSEAEPPPRARRRRPLVPGGNGKGRSPTRPHVEP
jgi:PAS domain S-box-containing protein